MDQSPFDRDSENYENKCLVPNEKFRLPGRYLTHTLKKALLVGPRENHLTQDEKYDLAHLLIKKVVYFEDGTTKGRKTGHIKMDLWELPPIDPSRKNSANGFAESNDWLPGRDSNPRQGG